MMQKQLVSRRRRPCDERVRPLLRRAMRQLTRRAHEPGRSVPTSTERLAVFSLPRMLSAGLSPMSKSSSSSAVGRAV